jgi:hypothetical protein
VELEDFAQRVDNDAIRVGRNGLRYGFCRREIT